jgi:hypothetical protein
MHIVTRLAFVDLGTTRGPLADAIFGSKRIFSELIDNIVKVSHESERDCVTAWLIVTARLIDDKNGQVC